ncbi:hypothetical protein ABIB73_000190 [Bradyrhizobium sp. F1.4.3]
MPLQRWVVGGKVGMLVWDYVRIRSGPETDG